MGTAPSLGKRHTVARADLAAAGWLEIWPPDEANAAATEAIPASLQRVVDQFQRGYSDAYADHGYGTLHVFESTVPGWNPTSPLCAVPAIVTDPSAKEVNGLTGFAGSEVDALIHKDCVKGWFGGSTPIITSTAFLDAFGGAGVVARTFVYGLEPYVQPDEGDIVWSFLYSPPHTPGVWWAVMFAGCTD